MSKYIPPYEISDEMIELISDITESIGNVGSINNLERLPRLRRANRIKSIHSSLAIENNTLTVEQVSDVLNGKKVIGPQDDILAVKNAFAVYNELNNIDPFSISDLLKIHKIMMYGLVEGAGKFRTSQVGVYNEKGEAIHIAPSCDIVPELITQLFDWLLTSKTPMLIKSCVFHYEFEFIHPFLDGNGRTGRFWQTALLANWKPIFAWIPIENMIKNNQEEYYTAIRLSTINGNSNAFIIFMLKIINLSIKNLINDTRKHYNHINNQITSLLSVMEDYPMSAAEIMIKLKLKSRDGFRNNYIRPALEAGLIGMTEPDKPTSKNQRYFKI